MKEKLLDYLLLETDVYKRPLRKRRVLLLLCAGAGLVIVLGYSVLYSVIMTLVMIFFLGIFSMVVYSWPAVDMAASVGKASGKMNIIVKRMKVAKGFLYAVIYTGSFSAILTMLFNSVFEYKGASAATFILSIFVSFWAGGMLTRCITAIFDETAKKKVLVFFLSSVWYYIIIMQIMDFIIKGAYSIIR